MNIHFKNSIVAGPAYRLWWHLHLDPAEEDKWRRYGAAHLTTAIIDNTGRSQLVAPIEALVTVDELADLIDPDRGIARTFDDVRAARDYEDRIKRHVPGLNEYWGSAASFIGELWWPRRPR